ncbi:MAG: hypothetical protein KZQ58_05500 [gamma proteobacterium symbiont of Bathyaustriella thionipta]|nr:hypothetical protein [gamma proteobacterium symbiont of Bathyaustriella thionipta]
MAKINTWQRFLYWLSGNLRCRIINGDHGEPYLERYHIMRLPGGGGIYLHRFLASDPDRGLHDHPWQRAFGLILSGGYEELRLIDGQGVLRQRKPGQYNFIRGHNFHRIILPQQRQAWSLFMHSGKNKGWGFLEIDSGNNHYRPHDAQQADGVHANWWQTARKGKHSVRHSLNP